MTDQGPEDDLQVRYLAEDPRDTSSPELFRHFSLSTARSPVNGRPVGALNRGQMGSDGVVQINMNPELRNQEDISKDLEFAPYYHVNRYGRNVKRSEVLGFGFISLIVISIALLAQLGLVSLGYLDDASTVNIHPPQTFTWKVLMEFFLSDSVTNLDKDCLFFKNKKRYLFRTSDNTDLFLEDLLPEEVYGPVVPVGNSSGAGGNPLPHSQRCRFSRFSNGWSWFIKYMQNMFFPFTSIFCSLIFLSSIRCRRRRGVQFCLIVPSFVCFFLDIFQQIPLTFHFNYANMVLMDDMQSASALTVPPVLIPPIWEETQIHDQCCGIQSPETWVNYQFTGHYPRSCCNTTAFSCSEGDSYPNRDQVWSTGCYQKQYERLRHFQGCGLLLLFLKLFAEVGLFWCLSDLTRYEYPEPEFLRSSQCFVKGFEITTKGCATILGVTERQKMAIKIRNLLPGRYAIRVDESPISQIIKIRTPGKVVGQIEIRYQRNQFFEGNHQHPVLDMERGRHRGLIFAAF